jgi:hypothetical protein
MLLISGLESMPKASTSKDDEKSYLWRVYACMHDPTEKWGLRGWRYLHFNRSYLTPATFLLTPTTFRM